MTIYVCFTMLTILAGLIYALVHNDLPKRHRAWLIWILMLGVFGGTTLLVTGDLVTLPGTVPP